MTDVQKYGMYLVRSYINCITAETNDADSMIKSLISSNSDYENTV